VLQQLYYRVAVKIERVKKLVRIARDGGTCDSLLGLTRFPGAHSSRKSSFIDGLVEQAVLGRSRVG
jgi:hypothetical protein